MQATRTAPLLRTPPVHGLHASAVGFCVCGVPARDEMDAAYIKPYPETRPAPKRALPQMFQNQL